MLEAIFENVLATFEFNRHNLLVDLFACTNQQEEFFGFLCLCLLRTSILLLTVYYCILSAKFFFCCDFLVCQGDTFRVIEFHNLHPCNLLNFRILKNTILLDLLSANLTLP